MSGTGEVEVVRAKCPAHTNALYIIRKQGCNARVGVFSSTGDCALVIDRYIFYFIFFKYTFSQHDLHSSIKNIFFKLRLVTFVIISVIFMMQMEGAKAASAPSIG